VRGGGRVRGRALVESVRSKVVRRSWSIFFGSEWLCGRLVVVSMGLESSVEAFCVKEFGLRHGRVRGRGSISGIVGG